MKFGELKAIAHNISDSLASGEGLLIGVFEMDVFGEAARTPEGFIEVDFLTGYISGGTTPAASWWQRLSDTLRGRASVQTPSRALSKAVILYAKALPELCQKHGTTREAFRRLSTRFHASTMFEVTIEDQHGRRSTDSYQGTPGRRLLELDPQGRVRPVPGVRIPTK